MIRAATVRERRAAAAPSRSRLGNCCTIRHSHLGGSETTRLGPPAGPASGYLSLLGFAAGTSLGLLFPGAWAGLPDGNCPGGKLAFDGAMRSSSLSIWKRRSFSLPTSMVTPPLVNGERTPVH